jgi:excisionase family DNA binding protein
VTTAPEYLRASEIARLCGVSVRTVRRWIAAETLPSVKVGGVRLVAREAVGQTLAPALPDWEDNDLENGEKTEACDSIGKQSSK